MSEFDPPPDVVAPLRDALVRLGEAGTMDPRWGSFASAPWGARHDIRKIATPIDTSFIAQGTNANPGGII